jgi:undecaprenyl-diphosphatase
VGVTIVVVAAIGASRLLLGVHFLTDVLAGHVLGVAWLVGATACFDVWRVERGRRPVQPLDEGVEPEAAAALGQASDGAPRRPVDR